MTTKGVWLLDRHTDRQMDRQTLDKMIPMCRYASQATQKCIFVYFLPQAVTNSKYSKLSKSCTLPRGLWYQWRVKQPLNEPIVQIWLRYHTIQTIFCILHVGGLQTDRWQKGQTIQLLDARGQKKFCGKLFALHILGTFTQTWDVLV